jgi:hypothetical protein
MFGAEFSIQDQTAKKRPTAMATLFRGLRATSKQIRLPQRAMGAAAGPGGAAHFHVSP